MLKFFIFFTVLTTTAFAQNREIKNLEAYCQLLKKEKSKKFQQYATYIDFLDQTSAEVADLLNQILDQYTAEDKSKLIAVNIRQDLDAAEKEVLAQELDQTTHQIALKFKLNPTKTDKFKVPEVSKTETATKAIPFRMNYLFTDKSYLITLCKGSICKTVNITDGDWKKADPVEIFRSAFAARKEKGFIDSKIEIENEKKPSLLNYLTTVLPNECLGDEEKKELKQIETRTASKTLANACHDVRLKDVTYLTSPNNNNLFNFKSTSEFWGRSIRNTLVATIDPSISNISVNVNAADFGIIAPGQDHLVSGPCTIYFRKRVETPTAIESFLMISPRIQLNLWYQDRTSTEYAQQSFSFFDTGHSLILLIECRFDFGGVHATLEYETYKTNSILNQNDLTLGQLRYWLVQSFNQTGFMKATMLPQPAECKEVKKY